MRLRDVLLDPQSPLQLTGSWPGKTHDQEELIVSRYLKLAPCLVVLLGVAPAHAQDADRSAAVTRAHEDPALQWGPCPDFLPEGCAISVLHGDPAQPNADVFFKVPGNSTLARHWHSSPERMVLVAGELQVTYDGHDPATLKPGTYAFGPARLPHSARCASSEPCVLAIAFEGPVDAHEGEPGDDPQAKQ